MDKEFENGMQTLISNLMTVTAKEIDVYIANLGRHKCDIVH